MNTEKLVKKVNKHDNDIIKVNEQLDNNTHDISALKNDKVDKEKIGIVTPEMFGVLCDGTDETKKIQDCINYAMNNNVNVEFRNGKEYSFTQLLIYKPCSINFNNAKLINLSDDETTSFIEIGNKNDSFDTKTLYSSKFNISNIYIDLNNKTRKYALELHVRHININRIVARGCVNDAIYLGDNDGVWIEQILCFGDNKNQNSKGVTIGCNDIILGNVECAYFKDGIFVNEIYNDIEIDKLHVWSDVENSSCIKYGGNSFYGHINSLIVDCTMYGINLENVDGYGKLNIDHVTVFPSTNFPTWQLVKEKFKQQSMGITIGNVIGIHDADTTLRFKNFYGVIKTLPNYNQRPKIYAEYSNISGSGHNFEQINGLLYQTSYAKITIPELRDRVELGFTIGINKLWDNLTIPVVMLGEDYNPISTVACMIITKDNGFKLHLSSSITGTYYIKLGTGLPINYFY